MGGSLRPPVRHALPCSCEVVVDLAGREAVAALLRAHGVTAEALAEARASVHAERETEPSDWRQRLPAGGSPGDLEQLLAIVRTADCHGYRVIESLGASCPALRRAVIERGPRRVGA